MIRRETRTDILTTLYGGNVIVVGLSDIIDAVIVVVLLISVSLGINMRVDDVKFVRLKKLFIIGVAIVVVVLLA